MQSKTKLILPGAIVGLRDLRRCVRALETVEDQLVSEEVKARAGAATARAVPVPGLVEELVRANGRQLKTKHDIDLLKTELEQLARRAPRFRILLSAEPDEDLMGRIVDWLRANVNLFILLDTTVSPYIAGGFILQTPTRRYDWSWRRRFEAQGTRFADLLRAGAGSNDGQ
jgi:hypothetical protein